MRTVGRIWYFKRLFDEDEHGNQIVMGANQNFEGAALLELMAHNYLCVRWSATSSMPLWHSIGTGSGHISERRRQMCRPLKTLFEILTNTELPREKRYQLMVV
jgi:hypothetical protein